MIRKISIAIATTLLAIFGIGHVRSLVTHGQLGCATVAAQDASDDDASADSATDDDTATEPEKKTKTPPPSVTGDWDGVLYNGSTPYPMQLDVTKQKGTKISGTWNASGYRERKYFHRYRQR